MQFCGKKRIFIATGIHIQNFNLFNTNNFDSLHLLSDNVCVTILKGQNMFTLFAVTNSQIVSD